MPDLLVASRMKSGLPKPRLVHSALPIPQQQQQQLCSRPSTRSSQAGADPQVRMWLSSAVLVVLPDREAAVEALTNIPESLMCIYVLAITYPNPLSLPCHPVTSAFDP